MEVLAVNTGSTSLKLERYRLDRPLPGIGEPVPPLETRTVERAEAARVLTELAPAVSAIAHRFVRVPDGAPPVLPIDGSAEQQLEALAAEAPLHNALAVEAVRALQPTGIPQFAVSDSAFHATMPAAAATYAIPRALTERGLVRRGYHGLNHEYVAHRAARLVGRDVTGLKIVSLHLGGGASLCALDGGASIDTTMGYTPLEGVPMATRSGTVDPGLLLHLLRAGMSVDELESTLDRRSGLFGISGLSGDVRQLEASAEPAARLALDVFVWRVRAALGAMIAVLGGVDVVAFTGGVGEHAADLRARIADGAVPWGARIDPAANATVAGDAVIGTAGPVSLTVVVAREGWQLARKIAER